MHTIPRNVAACSLAAAILASLSLTVSAAGAGTSPPVRKLMSLQRPAAEATFDRFIVKARTGIASRSASPTLDALRNAIARSGIGAGIGIAATGSSAPTVSRLRTMATGADVFRFSRKLTRTEADAVLAQLRADAAVQYAQPDYRRQRLDFTPNDTRFNLQWDYTHPTTGIRAPAAWDIARGAGVVVAVLDTGYLDHSDLNANIVPGYDFISDAQVAGDGDGRDADAHDPGDFIGGEASSFHGTHVAGTVAAVGNNALGIAGVAFSARVQPVRVLGHGGGYTSDIADAITWASGGTVAGVPANATPAEVLNLSLGGQGRCSEDPATQAAIDGAIARGTTVVISSGNSNLDAANFSPASCKGVITVGASGVDGARSYYSNYGPTVAISAPGGNATSGSDPDDRWIWSLGNSGLQAPDPSPAGDRLIGMIGTSMASPHVAGIVALMQSAAVGAGRAPLTPAQVKQVLQTTAIPFTIAPPFNQSQGPGIANAAAAVLAATQPIPDDTSTLLVNRIASTTSGAAGDTRLFKIVVPAGKTSLNLRTYGGTGNVSLYVARGRVPTASSFDRSSVKPGNSETVLLSYPQAGTYYMLVVGENAFGGVSVMGVY
ncbi:S8 family serine peptidase [Lysobacter sp. A6]|uniref:S8 family serine peptidase n=1 Tax=Noviluteimonas lactosilytica TaxID=2888523 RepID=A0ABS8JLN4_9GAMM|nr:S8 family peptidase [Lysobacter lactosilyticus]MCC8364348.1 S8 family serine peptidase [Lysobacter lactosilyticus]